MTTRLFAQIDLHFSHGTHTTKSPCFLSILLCFSGISRREAFCYLLFFFGGVKQKNDDAWIDVRIICGCLTQRFINVQLSNCNQLHAQNVSKYMEPLAAHITNERNNLRLEHLKLQLLQDAQNRPLQFHCRITGNLRQKVSTWKLFCFPNQHSSLGERSYYAHECTQTQIKQQILDS